MTLEELMRSPDTIDLNIPYGEALENYVRGKDYIQIGKVVQGTYAITYIQRDKFDEVLRDLGASRINLFPNVFGLVGRTELSASRYTSSARATLLGFKRKGSISWIFRYRN